MSKFRIKMKLQGLELEIEGSRDDASIISQSIGSQISSMMQPVTDIIEGETAINGARSLPAPQPIQTGNAKRARRRKSVASGGGETESVPAIDFVLSPEKYGSPAQQWSTASKATWLIYVLDANGHGSEFSTRTIVETFNKHFKQSGVITTSNVSRDLGRYKTNSKPPQVGENTTRTPST